MRAFYRTYFGAEEGAPYHNPRTGLSTWFLTFPEGGCRLELMTRRGSSPRRRHRFWPGTPISASRWAAGRRSISLTARLAADGFAVKSGPRVTGDGYYESCVLDPDGNEVELVG